MEQAVGSSVGQTETWTDLEEFELKSRKDEGESQARIRLVILATQPGILGETLSRNRK